VYRLALRTPELNKNYVLDSRRLPSQSRKGLPGFKASLLAQSALSTAVAWVHQMRIFQTVKEMAE
jgi:hypothetical protein